MADQERSDPNHRSRNSSKLPPCSVDAEAGILGAMLMDREAVAIAKSRLVADDFYFEKNRVLFDAMLRVHDRGAIVDVVTLAEEIERGGESDKLGGRATIAAIEEATPSAAHAGSYAGSVLDLSLLRGLVIAAQKCQSAVRGEGVRFGDAASAIESDLRALRLRTRSVMGPQAAHNIIPKIIEQYEIRSSPGWDWRNHSIMTGIDGLDEWIIGLKRGEMSIVKAERSKGKTAFGAQLANATAVDGGKCVVFQSCEMSRESIIERVSALRTGVPMEARTRGLNEQDMRSVMRDMGAIDCAPLHVNFDGVAEVDRMVAEIEASIISHDVWLVILDYIQCVTHKSKDFRDNTKERQVSYCADQFKRIAGEFNVHCCVLSQVNDEGGARWSKEAEDRGDVVLSIEKDEPWSKDGEIVVEKNRNGKTGAICIRWDGRRGMFSFDRERQNARRNDGA